MLSRRTQSHALAFSMSRSRTRITFHPPEVIAAEIVEDLVNQAFASEAVRRVVADASPSAGSMGDCGLAVQVRWQHAPVLAVVMSLAERSIHVTVGGEKWWVTAAVATGAALLGSFAGAGASYRASTALEDRRRRALSEIRRKAKVYTPIREELVALRRAIAEDRHLGYQGVLREVPDVRTWRHAPVLAVWRELVEDGRAVTSASATVREALDGLEQSTDRFNAARAATTEVFERRGRALEAETGFEPEIGNWPSAYIETIFREGIAESEVFRSIPERHAEGPPRNLTEEEQQFADAWEADTEVRAAISRLAQSEQELTAAVDAALIEIDHAMQRIAERYEHEPRD
jgi:hypothetical protein